MFIAQARRGIDPNIVRRCKGALPGDIEQNKIIKIQNELEKGGKYASVFICSYSDFFLPEADGWRDDAWGLIRQTPNLIWQICSKRTHLIADRLPADWGSGYPNVWLGTCVELKKYLLRLDQLCKIPCVMRWVDFSPTLARH
jgi:protein gp37